MAMKKAALRIACGESHTLAVTEKQALLAWGGNYFGQVGDGTTADVLEPVFIIKENVCACAAGRCHSLAVTTSGEVYAWGNNDDGLLGTSMKMKQELPAKVPIDSAVKAVSAGWKHCLALTEEGEVLAWGGNEYGQLGDGTRTARRRPVKVDFGERIQAIASGWYHNLALTESGSVWHWGFHGQGCTWKQDHGQGGASAQTLTPALIVPSGVSAIAAGAGHNLALTDRGAVLVWGSNDHGQLGDGSKIRRVKPVTIATNCIAVAAGSYCSMALDENYNVVQWGFAMTRIGSYSAGTWTDIVTPTRVPIDGGAFAITAGGVHSVAISNRGQLFVWGGNSCGQVGDGKVADCGMPVCVLPPSTMETIPADEIIAKIMKGPAELVAEAGIEKKRIRQEQMVKSKSSSRQTFAGCEVPELLRKIVGDHPRPKSSFNTTYPLSFNGSPPPKTSAMSRTSSQGFLPGTGNRPGAGGSTMGALTAGTSNPRRLQPLWNRPPERPALTFMEESQSRKLPSITASRSDGFLQAKGLMDQGSSQQMSQPQSIMDGLMDKLQRISDINRLEGGSIDH